MNTVDFSSFLPLVLVFAAMYFFVIRPQSKKAKEHKLMLDSLQKKDTIVTSGGLVGSVSSLTEREVKLEVASGVVVTVLRSMIAEKVTGMPIRQESAAVKEPSKAPTPKTRTTKAPTKSTAARKSSTARSSKSPKSKS